MKTYQGDRTIDGILVTVDGIPLDARLDLETFTRNGFEWTFEGDESRQLALAILADHLGDDSRALALAEGFMREVVANFDNTWEMTSHDVAEVSPRSTADPERTRETVMPVYLKLIVSALALILCTSVFLVDAEGGTARWIALALGPLMVFSIWVFPEPKADAIRKEAAERRS